MKFTKFTATVAASAMLVASAVAPALAKEWKPRSDIEMVVPFSAGGGSDINARVVSQIITDNKLIDKNITVSNRPGASGATGTAYAASKQGNPHVLLTTVAGQLAALIANKTPVQLEHLTPLATLALDPLMVVVKKDAPWQTFEEFLAASRADRDKVTVGGVGLFADDQIALALLDADGEDGISYVSYGGSGEVAAAVLGGHVSAGMFNPSEVLGQLQAGEMRALGITTPERVPGILGDVPTFVEQGYPKAIWAQFRGYAAPAGIKPEEVKFWSDVFMGVGATDAWKAEIDKNSLVQVNWDAEESAKQWKLTEEQINAVMGRMQN